MAVNKVNYGSDTLIDLTGDTVTAAALESGVTAHDASGQQITGTADHRIASETDNSLIVNSADGMLQSITIFGRSESGSSVGDNGLVIKTTGKNLAQTPENYPVVTSGTAADWTITKNDDGSFYITGESTAETYLTIAPLEHLLDLREGEQYVLSGGTSDNSWASKFIFLSSNSSDYNVRVLGADEVEFTAPDVSQYPRFYMGLHIAKNYALDHVLIQPMIRPVGTSPDFEAHKETSCTITTGLPLRGVNDVCDTLSFGAGVAEAVTRCYYDETAGEVRELSEPVTTPLTAAEIRALRGLKTYNSVTNISVSDAPDIALIYLVSSDNGRAVAGLQTDMQGQIDGLQGQLDSKQNAESGKGLSTNDYTTAEKNKVALLDDPAGYAAYKVLITGASKRVTYSPVTSSELSQLIGVTGNVQTQLNAKATCTDFTVSLPAASWSDQAAPYAQTVAVAGLLAADKPIIDVSVSGTTEAGLAQIKDFALISRVTTAAGSMTFECYEDIPTVDLTINVKVVR